MTDDDLDLDRRLQVAGERWRAATTDSADLVTVRPAAPHRPWWLLASAAALVALLVGGALKLSSFGDPARRSGGPPIANVTWHARSVLPATGNGKLPADHDQPLGRAAYLKFHAGGYTGSDGCNELNGSAVVRGKTIDFRDTLRTEVGCTGADLVARILTGTVRYSVTSSSLTITKAGTGTLVLTRAPALRPTLSTLPGSWVLTGTQTVSKDGNTVSGSSVSPAGDSLRLEISSSGGYALSLRCIRLQGQLDRQRRTIANVKHVGTRCHVSRSVEQQEYFLQDTVTYGATLTVEGGSLRITRSTRTAIFERA